MTARPLRMTVAARLLPVCAAAAALLLAGMPGAAWAETRLALVVGNARYEGVPSLRNSVEDARAMRRQLEAAGFTVVYREDAGRRAMNRAVDEFVGRLSSDSVALFYYAGHGVQIGAANFLIPTDVRAETANDVASDGIDLTRVLERVTATQARFALAIIDACRDNPFRVAGRTLGVGRGLAPTTTADGVMVVYSAGANQVALDRLGDGDANPNGVFTREWLRAMAQPGLSVQAVATQVRQSVAALARTVGHVQTPAVYDQSLGTFEFVSASAPAPQAALTTTPPGPAPPSLALLPLPPQPLPPSGQAPPPSAPPQPRAALPAGPAPAHECDRLGQPPRYLMGSLPVSADGVPVRELDASAARAACGRAMAEWPGELRFATYAARAADKAGDTREAVRLYRHAAEGGEPVAQANLGVLHRTGRGLPRDEREAARLYRLAAAHGYARAQNNLATMYRTGAGGLPRDDREAARLFRLAADGGDPEAQLNLGNMYHLGIGGLPKDTREAVRLWRLAAERGDAQAQNNLASAYALGQGGLPRDREEAVRLFRLAADQGYAEARKNLQRLGAERQGARR